MSTAASDERNQETESPVRKPSGLRRRLRILSKPVAITMFVLTAVAVASGGGLGITPALAAGPEVTGQGSSYADPALQTWSTQVRTLYGDNVNYQVSSSVTGLNFFAQNQVTFGASEIGYSTGQMSYTPTKPYQYLPDVAGATCLMYNVSGRLGNRITNLSLSPKVLAEIWTGTISRWNDPQIAAINSGVVLPSAPIVAVYREDASGENYLFSQYLNYMEPQVWQPFVSTLQSGANVTAIWPTGTNHGKYNLSSFVGQTGSDNASEYVTTIGDSITYVETAYAIEHNMPCAFVQNASGNWVQPSELTDAVGLERATLLPDLEQELDGVYSNPLPTAYPISAYSYLVTPKGAGSMSSAQGAVLGRFIRYFACQGQADAGPLGYSPLPANLVTADFAAINRIPGAATAPAQATAANCQGNPYVDGQINLPEPCIQGQACNNGGGSTTTTTTTASGPGSTTSGQSGTTTPGGTTATTTPATGGSTHRGHGGKKSTGGQHYGCSSGCGPAPTKGKAGSSSLADGLWPGQKILSGGATTVNGQGIGNELASENFSMLGLRLSTATMWLSACLLLTLIGLPPTLARARRRRKPSQGTAAPLDATAAIRRSAS
jgi:phosphate ABC transporter phosphate-binding protein